MTNNQVAIQLEYAKLQLAAEAMFGVKHVDLAGKQETRPIDEAWLTDGNDHSSRFTQPQADEFVKNWALVEHKANTETGFSGTLFKYIGSDNPGRRRVVLLASDDGGAAHVKVVVASFMQPGALS